MDETSTSSIASTEKMLRAALKNERYGSPSDKTIDFIRSFASGFHFIDGLPEKMATYSLNQKADYLVEQINKFEMSVLVAPSLLSADFGDLRKDLEMINSSDADWLHLDIMDGVFVPNISFGFPVLEYVAKYCTKPLDVHLMIVQPEKFLDRFQKLGAMSVNVHYETCTHLNRVIQEIKNLGMKAAVTLNPSTPVSVLEEVIEDVDMVLLMTVNPGFGGQKFIKSSLAKIGRLKKMILEHNSKALIQVDGGVNFETAPLLVEAGVDVLVSGNTVFKADNPLETIKKLKQL